MTLSIFEEEVSRLKLYTEMLGFKLICQKPTCLLVLMRRLMGGKLYTEFFRVYCCARTLSVRMQRRLQIEIAHRFVRVQVVQTPQLQDQRSMC
jgi:hypothetical protein